jgi:hypothetical protein
MSRSEIASTRNRLQAVIALASILERIESSSAPVSADQYQVVVARLKAALSENLPDDVLQAVLNAHPCDAELYENMHYEQSGLSRSSLEQSVSSEMLAAEALARLARSSKASG